MALERSITAAIAGAAVLALVACSGGDETQDAETSETLQSLENVRDTSELPKYMPGQVLVRFEDDAAEGAVADQLLQRHQSFASLARAGNVDALNSEHRARRFVRVLGKSATLPQGRISDADARQVAATQNAAPLYRVEFEDPNINVEQVAAEYARDPSIRYAVPNQLYYTQMTPNDPMYDQQWSLKTSSIESAWDLQSGDPSVVVAVIDTGVDYAHEDLSAQVWHDGQGNPGWDTVDVDTAPLVAAGLTLVDGEDYTDPDADPMDVQGHGTHCAGIVAAAANNAIGVAGVAPGTRIMPVRAGFAIYDSLGRKTGAFTAENIAAALDYASTAGATIVTMSIGGFPNPVTQEAVETAAARGTILVAAAGNSNSSSESYPAAYSEVIAVAATGPDGSKSSFSNFGRWVDVAAPGGESTGESEDCVLSTLPGGYGYACGTSMAGPYAAGVAALVVSQMPGISAQEVRGRLMGTATPVEGPYEELLGGGSVDPLAAITAPRTPMLRAASYAMSEVDGDGDLIPEAGETAALTVQVDNEWAQANNVMAFVTDSSPELTVLDHQWNAGTIPDFGSATNTNDPIEFAIDPNVGLGQPVSLQLSIWSNYQLQAEVSVELNVGWRTLASVYQIMSFDVSGDHAAWVRYEEDLNALNVFAANLETGELTRITQLETNGGLMDILEGPQALAISGSRIVWQDARNGVGSEDLYVYDLTAGQEQLLVGAEGSQQSPDIYGDLVVWMDTRDDAGDIHLLDLTTGQETAFAAEGKQKFPKVTEGVVGWVHEDTAIVLHDLATGDETTVPTAPGTMHAFDISGSTVAYRLYDEGAKAYGVWISDFEGSNARQVVAPTSGATHFGLYGTTVVYNAQGLHAYDLATDTTVVISDTAGTAFFPQMSGSRVVWQSLNALDERHLTLAQLGPALGDANLDGAVTGADANAIAQYSVGNPVDPFDEGAADVNCDGAITITDALRVAQKANGSLDYFPCELN